ncbi:hypothetical protein VTN31DRAFT_4074 [Thermomyces dupontii]|uniref:uncharacterized protein n=1 Tax=Talaromyces thermophilus TaxID=28565 RepID=UPI0037445E6F
MALFSITLTVWYSFSPSGFTSLVMHSLLHTTEPNCQASRGAIAEGTTSRGWTGGLIFPALNARLHPATTWGVTGQSKLGEDPSRRL